MGTQLVGRSFTLADKKSQISIFPKQKKYIEVALTEKNRIENGDPKLIVEAFLQGDYKELGRREINGVTLKGIQSDDVSPTGGFPGGRGLMDALKDESSAKVLASLWVDIATGWPVEITMDITDEDGNEQMTIVVSDFQWDTQIDPATFGPTVTANDANKVLLRWKLSDGQYRVILGDLQIKDVDAAQLAQLEAQ